MGRLSRWLIKPSFWKKQAGYEILNQPQKALWHRQDDGIKSVHYLAWEDAFDVEFEDGLSFLEPHATIRKANRISPKAQPVEVVLDDECRIGFEIRYDNRQVAEVSWSFIRELPPKK